MKRILLLTGLMFFQFIFAICPAQNTSRSISAIDTIPFGLKPHEWNKMQEIWTRKNRPVQVLLYSGNSLTGQILHLYNDTVVFYVDSSSFINQYVAANDIVYLHRDSIVNNLHAPESKSRSGLFWGTTTGAAMGVVLFFAGGGYAPPVLVIAPSLIGAGIGIYKDSKKNRNMTEPHVLDLNSEEARKRVLLFPDHLPGLSGTREHASDITPETFATASFDDLLNASPQAGRLFGTPVISLSGYAGRTSIEKNHSNFRRNFGFTFTYRPLKRIKTGYQFKVVTTLENPLYEYTQYGSNLFFYENAYISSHTLLVKYVPLSANSFLTRRFEVSAGIGFSFNTLSHQSHIRHNELWEVLTSEDSTIRNTGLALMSDVDFYISRHISFYLSLNKSLNKPFKPKDLNAVNPLTGENIFHKTMEVYPSPLDFMVGLRLHLMRR
jgi:hypothetical protein